MTHSVFWLWRSLYEQEIGAGRYQAAVSFAMPGPWRVTVTVTPPGGPAVTKTLDYKVSWE